MFCVSPECERDSKSRGLCQRHYDMARSAGTLESYPIGVKPRRRHDGGPGRAQTSHRKPSKSVRKGWEDAPACIWPDEACSSRTRSRSLCEKHYLRAKKLARLDEFPLIGWVKELGAKTVTREGYINVKTERGTLPEHRLVMENHIGRRLVGRESVHHKNGIRDDNRLDNLELWASHQPYGQRVDDLLDYVLEFHSEELTKRLLQNLSPVDGHDSEALEAVQ